MVDLQRIERLLATIYNIKGHYRINPQTGVVDVNGNVSVLKLGSFNKIKSLSVQFGHVKGHFDCSWQNLSSLKGAPHTVDGDFDCGVNRLTSLRYAPVSVGGSFNCSLNKLATLKYLPKTIGGSLKCRENSLTTLEFCPAHVKGAFNVNHNNLLTTLEHGPQQVDGDYSIAGCYALQDLDHLPNRGSFIRLSYKTNFALLRCLNFDRVEIFDQFNILNEQQYDSINRILNQHAGQGQQGALACAAELADAGFKENARW